MPGSQFYRKWALWYRNIATLEGLDAVAYVEGKTDKPFWRAVFTEAGLKVRILSGGDNPEHKATGKSQCLKYMPYLSSRFIICIDSDYDYLRQTHPEYNPGNYVLQTYTYAIENHYLAATATALPFLKKYSKMIYNAFLNHMEDGSPIAEFCMLTTPEDIREKTLERLQRRVREHYPDIKPNPYVQQGLAEDNVYLFIKAKALRGKVSKCSSQLSFTHFPMDKLLAEVRMMFPRLLCVK